MSESPTIDPSRVTDSLNVTNIDAGADATIHQCKCGLTYLSRQGLHRHVTKMRDHQQHRDINWD